jgi:hypothetical protein
VGPPDCLHDTTLRKQEQEAKGGRQDIPEHPGETTILASSLHKGAFGDLPLRRDDGVPRVESPCKSTSGSDPGARRARGACSE